MVMKAAGMKTAQVNDRSDAVLQANAESALARTEAAAEAATRKAESALSRLQNFQHDPTKAKGASPPKKQDDRDHQRWNRRGRGGGGKGGWRR